MMCAREGLGGLLLRGAGRLHGVEEGAGAGGNLWHTG